MKDSFEELKTFKSVDEIAEILRNLAYELKADVDEIEMEFNPLDRYTGARPYDLAVVFSGRLGFLGGFKHFRAGAAHDIWGVQIYVQDEGDHRLVLLNALGESGFANWLGAKGSLNMGASKEKREKIYQALV